MQSYIKLQARRAAKKHPVAHCRRLSEKFYRFLQKHSFTSRVFRNVLRICRAGVLFNNRNYLAGRV
jgi:hypothetical protein